MTTHTGLFMKQRPISLPFSRLGCLRSIYQHLAWEGLKRKLSVIPAWRETKDEIGVNLPKPLWYGL